MLSPTHREELQHSWSCALLMESYIQALLKIGHASKSTHKTRIKIYISSWLSRADCTDMCLCLNTNINRFWPIRFFYAYITSKMSFRLLNPTPPHLSTSRRQTLWKFESHCACFREYWMHRGPVLDVIMSVAVWKVPNYATATPSLPCRNVTLNLIP